MTDGKNEAKRCRIGSPSRGGTFLAQAGPHPRWTQTAAMICAVEAPVLPVNGAPLHPLSRPSLFIPQPDLSYNNSHVSAASPTCLVLKGLESLWKRFPQFRFEA
jgi:hypothetical protein